MDTVSRIQMVSVSILLVLCVTQLRAQTSNPFELVHRWERMGLDPESDSTVRQWDSTTLHDTVIASADTVRPSKAEEKERSASRQVGVHDSSRNNTADITDSVSGNARQEQVDSLHEVGDIRENVGELSVPEFVQSKRNIIFGTFIVLALFITVVISFNRNIVNKVFRSILNDNYLNLLYREQKGQWSMQFIFLYIFFFMNVGLLVYLLSQTWNLRDMNWNLLMLFLFVAGIYLIRHFSMYYIGQTFDLVKETGQFSFSIMLFNILLGLFLFPINAFIAYAPNYISNIFIFIGLILIILFYIIRQLRGLFIASSVLTRYQFHFLLYLCTIEIAPLLVMISFFRPYFD